MSLDLYLVVDNPVKRISQTEVFVREGGVTRELTVDECKARYPDYSPCGAGVEYETNVVWQGNITHNLGKMAAEAGIYKALWRPEEIGIVTASQLIEPLEAGLVLLRGDPDRFMEFNPPNGWGSYESLVDFVEGCLAACREFKDATVEASR